MVPAIILMWSSLRKSPMWSPRSSRSSLPRAGLRPADVVRAAAEVADELGYQHLALGLVAERLGVRAPSLYKHVAGLGDLQRQLATLAMTELGDAIAAAAAGLA